MNQYNFETLNSKDFEHLVRDLLNAEAKASQNQLRYSSFPEGKDRGIDLLDNQSFNRKYNVVVQIKHQPHIPFPTFLALLSRTTKTHISELKKIQRLNPNRYILATSRPLTLANRESIVDAMKPYIHSLADIIDQEELNKLISSHPEIELHHPKLWFSSVPLFEKILYNDVHQRSEQLAIDIRRKLKLYVPIYSISNALSILKSKKILVITGEPGCGKTTFAEIILHKLAGLEYKAYWIDKSVKEIEGQLRDDDSKQAFYFDDFLGHTRYEIEMEKTHEKGLLHFLKRLIQLKNKYFILTTRSSILNSATIDSERFRTSGHFKKCHEIKVEEMFIKQRMALINNHLDVKEVKPEYRDHLTENLLIKIAEHKNFSPRLIEFVTNSINYLETNPKNYYDYIVNHLENPNEVWRHAYEQQLDDHDRFLLTTLYSFGNAVHQNTLEDAYEERVSYEIQYNNIAREADSFRRSLKKLLGSFITFKRYYKEDRLDFINPSIEDFLTFYLKNNHTEKLRILNSFKFLNQIYNRFRLTNEHFLVVRPGEIFRLKLLSGNYKISNWPQDKEAKSLTNLYSAIILKMFFTDKEATKDILSFLQKVDWKYLKEGHYFHISTFLTVALDDIELKHFIKKNFYDIIMHLIDLSFEEHLENIKLLFEVYDIDYADFIAIEIYRANIKSHIDFFFENDIFVEMEEIHDLVTSIEQVAEIRSEFEQKILHLYALMEIDGPANLHGFDEVNWEKICEENEFTEQMRKEDEERGAILPDD